MATIRLVEKLNKEILSRAAMIFDSRIVASNTVPPEFNTKDIYELYLDLTPGLRADTEIGIKHGWLCRATSLKILSLNQHQVNVQCYEHNPGVMVSYPLAQSYGTGLTLKGERAKELYAIWKEWRENYAMVRTQRDQFATQIKNLLARHQTLKQALGEWPALWEYIPQEFKDKHNEEKARAAKAKNEPENKPAVDLDVLNGAVVTAKILKGGFGQ
jgi:hypothetical protein